MREAAEQSTPVASAVSALALDAEFRRAHPGIAAGDAVIAGLVLDFCRTRPEPVRVVELGCATGMLLERMARDLQATGIRARLTGCEILPEVAAAARSRLDPLGVAVDSRTLEQWSEQIDLVISWGSHHHTDPAYLGHVRRLLAPGGRFLLGDEFCPAFSATAAPEGAGDARRKEAEVQRRRALWVWYRHVIDTAMERRADLVVAAELRAAADDLETQGSGEHKYPVDAAERLLAASGFVTAERHLLPLWPGEDVPADPALRSFHVLDIRKAERVT